MRKLALSLVVLGVFAPAVFAAPVDVKIKDNLFKPTRVTIHKGGKVVWHWKGSNPHNVAIKKPGASRVSTRSAIKTSGRYGFRFRRTGTWKVLCEVHPTKMRMKVIVRG
jgi:plastocyanin